MNDITVQEWSDKNNLIYLGKAISEYAFMSMTEGYFTISSCDMKKLIL